MRYVPDFALPDRAYLPGESSSRPEVAIDGADIPLRRELFASHRGLGAGVDLFNRGFFWRAHEVWEQGWKTSDGGERELLQGLIQLAAAALQRQLDKSEGAARIIGRAREHLRAARELGGAIFCGIDLDTVLDEAASGTIVWRRRSRDLPATFSQMAVQPLECSFARCASGIAQTTTTRDNYFSGNIIWADEAIAVESADAMTDARALCASELDAPARYHNIQWELEGACAPTAKTELAEFDHFVVLRASALSAPKRPENADIRPLVSDADWRAAAELCIELNAPKYGPGLAEYTHWTYASYRQTLEVLGGAFWGAFARGQLASCLGVVAVGEGFRYQEVQTREAFRRRGLARALVADSFAHMREAGYGRGIIVAEPNSVAEKIYRDLGFEQVSTTFYLRFKLAAGESAAP